MALVQACDLQIWMARPEDVDAAQWPELASGLGSLERCRAESFRLQADRHAYILAHAVRRQAVAHELAADPRSLLFLNAASGKPVLAAPGHSGVYFSHSHTRGLVACAVTRVGPVGIDAACLADAGVDLALLSGFVALPDAQRREAELGSDVSQQFFFTGRSLKPTGSPREPACRSPIHRFAVRKPKKAGSLFYGLQANFGVLARSPCRCSRRPAP